MLTPTWKAPFQFTPLREGRHILSRLAEYYGVFQFTPLREGRRQVRYELIPTQRISIHAPPRGATTASAGRTTGKVFQFTPLREGRPRGGNVVDCQRQNFNSRPSARGDRTATSFLRATSSYFNSRPSARGDDRQRQKPVAAEHFNSRPSARGDLHDFFGCGVLVYFNSRPSARGDGFQPILMRGKLISIHAPPRGATKGCHRAGYGGAHFNSRPSARGDDTDSATLLVPPAFQFTPLREGRRQANAAGKRKERFQFTPLREGRLHQADMMAIADTISIHAPPRGATRFHY